MSSFDGPTNVANCVIVSEEWIVLLRQIGKKPPLFWKFPGGRFTVGETPEQALHREVDEEVDLDLSGVPLTLLDQFEQSGRSGETYTQFLFMAQVPKALLHRHLRGIVTCIDQEQVMLESTCFQLNSLRNMNDLLIKHWNMLSQIREKSGLVF